MSLLRKARRSTLKAILVWACLMIPASAFLYSTNGQVRALENEITATAQDVSHEKESLRVLRAEWAYLNNPQRLSNATKAYLTGAQVMAAAQILPLDRLTTKIAMRESAPVASAENGSVTIAATVKAPAMLAKPISFDPGLLSTLHRDRKATLPSSASWSQKMVSAFGMIPVAFTPEKASSTP